MPFFISEGEECTTLPMPTSYMVLSGESRNIPPADAGKALHDFSAMAGAVVNAPLKPAR
jgi:hypothetical protein